MKAVRYLILRIIFLLLVGLGTAWTYSHYLWKKDIRAYAPLLEKLWNAADSADVIYFAESSNVTFADTDSVSSTISELTAAYFPDKVFHSIDQPAAHARTFLALIRQIPENTRVKTIVVTMNLRSFDAGWINSELENNLERMTTMYGLHHPLINKLKMSLGAYDKKSVQQRNADLEYAWTHDTLRFPFPHEQVTVRAWDNFMANGYYLNADGSWDMPKITLACHFIKTYAFQIDTLKNPRIKDFDEIVKAAREKKLNLVFNLLAENMQYADSLVGKPLTYLMRQNRDLLVERYTRLGATVTDNLEAVEGKEFIDQNWTTEHYFLTGRRIIAGRLAATLKPVVTGQ